MLALELPGPQSHQVAQQSRTSRSGVFKAVKADDFGKNILCETYWPSRRSPEARRCSECSSWSRSLKVLSAQGRKCFGLCGSRRQEGRWFDGTFLSAEGCLSLTSPKGDAVRVGPELREQSRDVGASTCANEQETLVLVTANLSVF